MTTQNDAKRAKAEDPAVTNFRDYLKIKTVQPDPDYGSAAEFLKRMAAELGLPYTITEPVAKKPVFIMTWEGTDPSLPSVVLNSHIDVVPVFPEMWKYDPFAAHKDELGNIYARGSQDMKCVGIQYLEAIRRLKEAGKRFVRTFHVSFVPDEEIGGVDGMKKFIEMDEFKKLNVGFALDEGLANPHDEFKVYYGERIVRTVTITCLGNPGHGSQFVENTAGEKLRRIINSFLDYRETEKKRLEDNPNLTLGDVTTVNFTIVEGGIQYNVLPAEMKGVFDIRMTPTFDPDQLEEMIAGWCKAAGKDVSYEFKAELLRQKLTPITKDDPWFNAFSGACDRLGLKTELELFPAATDSRFLRSKGYPALGFSPMNKTPILLHDHNEFLNEDIFLRGIDIYCEILTALGNVPGK